MENGHNTNDHLSGAEGDSIGLWRFVPSFGKRGEPSAAYLLLLTIGTIFLVEAIIMLVVNQLPPVSIISVVLLDAVILIIVVFPFLYIFLYRPMSLKITESKRAEERLKEAENQSRAWLEHSPICTKIVDLDFNLQYMSSSGIRDLKIQDTAQIYGKPYPFVFYPESYRRQMTEKLTRARDTGEVITHEAAVVDIEGNEIWYHSTIVLVHNNERQVEYLIVVSIETTERKRAEERLRESEERYRTIFETAAVSIWEEDFSAIHASIEDLKAQGVTDFQTYLDEHPEFLLEASQMVKIVDVNDTTLKMFGAPSKEELLGSLDKVFLPDTLHIFREEILAIAEGKTYFEGETINQTLQGEQLNVRVMMTIPTKVEKLHSVLVSVIDITKRKRAEEEIKKRNQDLVTLNTISSKLNRYPNLDSILKVALQQIVDIARVDGAECHLQGEEGNLTLRKTWGLNDAFVIASQDFHFPVGEGIPGITISRREPVYVADSTTDERYWRRDLASAAGYRSLLCVPILGEEVLLGTFMLYSREHHEFPPELRELMMTIGALLGGAIRRAQAEAALREREEQFRRLVENIPGAVYRCEPKLPYRTIYVSQGISSICGYPVSDFTSHALDFGTLEHPDDAVEADQILYESVANHQPFEIDYRILHADGSIRWVSEKGQAVYNDDGVALWLDGVITDITELKRAEEEIKKRNQDLVTLNTISSKLNRYTNLDSILKVALQQIVDIARVDGAECHLQDEEGNLTLRKTWGLNDAFVIASQDFHFPVGEGIPGITFSRREPVYVADSTTDERYWRRDLARAAGYRSLLCVPILGEEVLLGTFMLYSHEHHEFPPEVRELMMTIGALLGGAIRRAQAEAALKLNARVFESATEGILITDAQANIITVNQAFEIITGYEQEDVTGENPRVLNSGRHGDDFYWAMWESLEGTGQWQGEIWNRRKDGAVYPQWLSISAVYTEDGQVSNYIGVFTDITVRKEIEDYFQHVATHDPLTDLPNRTLFQDKLAHALVLAKRNNRQVAVLFLDLDGFKSVNDTFGHDKGDQVLQEMAKKMKRCVRESDTVARLAGDEFTVILENIANAEDAAEVAGKLITQLSEPLKFGGIEITLTSSLGISLYPQDGDNVITLLKHADMAMYRAKQAGKANYQFYAGESGAEKPL